MENPEPVEVDAEVLTITNLNQYLLPATTGKLNPVILANEVPVVVTSELIIVDNILLDTGDPIEFGVSLMDPSDVKTLNPSPL